MPVTGHALLPVPPQKAGISITPSDESSASPQLHFQHLFLRHLTFFPYHGSKFFPIMQENRLFLLFQEIQRYLNLPFLVPVHHAYPPLFPFPAGISHDLPHFRTGKYKGLVPHRGHSLEQIHERTFQIIRIMVGKMSNRRQEYYGLGKLVRPRESACGQLFTGVTSAGPAIRRVKGKAT